MIYNGVEIADFSDPSCDRAAVRREIGLPGDQFMILQVARLDYLKDHATAIRAIRRVTDIKPDARLVLVGEGPERPTIEAEIQRLGVGYCVRVLGLVDNPRPLLQSADAFLLTSISEGISVTVIEAMAAGLPVVTTDVGGLREMVVEGQTGLFAPPGDDAALASALLQLADSTPLREQMGAAGRAHAKSRFSQHSMHEHYCRTYDEMLLDVK